MNARRSTPSAGSARESSRFVTNVTGLQVLSAAIFDSLSWGTRELRRPRCGGASRGPRGRPDRAANIATDLRRIPREVLEIAECAAPRGRSPYRIPEAHGGA